MEEKYIGDHIYSLTKTIAEFKEAEHIDKIEIRKRENTGEVYFICNNTEKGTIIEGKVDNCEIPKHPVISKVIMPLEYKIFYVIHEDFNTRDKIVATL